MSSLESAPASRVAVAGRDVARLGFGAMRLTGPKIMGPPRDRDEAVRVVRRAVELGVQVIDTAWYYGPDVADEIIAQALRPYPDDVVLVTKLGGARRPSGAWYAANRTEELRAGAQRDLRLLGLDTVPLAHLRWMPGSATFGECLDGMLALVAEGLVERIGLSNVSREQLEVALGRTEIASVSNAYSVLDRSDEEVVGRCEALGIPYLPFFPLGASTTGGSRVEGDARFDEVARELGVSRIQLALAWLLHRSPTIVPIPGTSSVAHVEDNWGAMALALDEEVIDVLDALDVPARAR